MSNEIYFEPHNKILNGVNKLADAVTETLGPRGSNVIISKKRGYPTVTKDGVTVARNITLSDELENIGALLVKEVASKSNDNAGDGTTTATVIARAIFQKGMDIVNNGYNPIDLKRELDDSVANAVKELEKNTKKIDSLEEVRNVALVSTNNDVELSDFISRAVHRVGVNGMVSVEESKTSNTELKFAEGLQIERGLVSQYFCTDITRLRSSYNDAHILVVNHEIDSLDSISPALLWAKETKKPLIIFAHEYEDNVLAAIIANKVKLGIKVACLHTPGTSDYKPDYMKDLCAATGATIFQPDYSPMLKEFKPEYLGKVSKITSSMHETTLIFDKDISEHVEELKQSIEVCEDDFYKAKLKDRYARLTSGIAILSLGSQSVTEMKDKKYRVEDAINATRAALEEGVLPGGGVALYKLRPKSGGLYADSILRFALEAPIKAILANCGIKSESVLPTIDGYPEFPHGYDARENVFCNLYDAGIIDPLKVTRSSLQNAASVAGMLLTTSCCIIQEESKDEQ